MTELGENRLRRIMLALFCLGATGTGAELVLLGHTEHVAQLVPLFALGAGIVTAAVALARPGAVTLRSFQFVMACFLMIGPIGLYLHYRGNVEFELEMYPSLSGLELVWKTLTGATPVLAPAAMILLGFWGLASTYRHPELSRSTTARQSR